MQKAVKLSGSKPGLLSDLWPLNNHVIAKLSSF